MPVASPVNKQTSQENLTPPPASAALSLIDTLPIKLVMMLAAPYLAGRTAEEALQKAHKIYAATRFASTIDILGEDARVSEDCDRSVENYKNLLELIAANPVQAQNPLQRITVSFKPSMFSIVSPAAAQADKQKHLERAYERIESIVDYARARQINVTLEAEDHQWTDFHLEAYLALINKGYTNCGTVLQSRLFRTKHDLKRFDERMRVRMLIGIYNEPAAIALSDKAEMKKLAVEYSRELLGRGVYVELASHDTGCLKSFIEDAVLPTRSQANRFELQHLLGVPRRELQEAFCSGKYFIELAEQASAARRDHLSELARSGGLMRMYLPFGYDKVAGPYCKRRLKANPNMIAYGIKNLLHIK